MSPNKRREATEYRRLTGNVGLYEMSKGFRKCIVVLAIATVGACIYWQSTYPTLGLPDRLESFRWWLGTFHNTRAVVTASNNTNRAIRIVIKGVVRKQKSIDDRPEEYIQMLMSNTTGRILEVWRYAYDGEPLLWFYRKSDREWVYDKHYWCGTGSEAHTMKPGDMIEWHTRIDAFTSRRGALLIASNLQEPGETNVLTSILATTDEFRLK